MEFPVVLDQGDEIFLLHSYDVGRLRSGDRRRPLGVGFIEEGVFSEVLALS